MVGIGAMNLDQIYRVEKILNNGESVARNFKLSPGGSAANTICGLARLEVRTGFIGAVGNDKEGRIITKALAKEGVDTSRIKVKPKAKTGLSLCLSDKEGNRSLYLLPGANSLLGSDDMDLDYVNQAKLCHLSSFVNEAQLEAQKEIVRSLSPSIKLSLAPGAIYAGKGIKKLKPLLKRTDILLINRDEIEQLSQENWFSGAQSCLEIGCQVVVVTFGGGSKYAAYIFSSEEPQPIEAKPYKGKLIDTTGAGDAFAAGFLYGFLQGERLYQCGILAELVARFSLSKIGAREGLPSLAQLRQAW